MKTFISYCDDGKGLQFARRAKQLLKEKDIEGWVWKDDSSAAKWLKTEIANNVEDSNGILIIVTDGTNDSDPQKEEWSFGASFGKPHVSIRDSGNSIPPELRSKYCPEFTDSDFDGVCSKVIDDLRQCIESSRKVPIKQSSSEEYKLHDIAQKLTSRQEGLEQERIMEFNDSVWEG